MDLREKLASIIIDELELEDIQPENIPGDMPLFGEGLSLDSLDAVELVVIIRRHFGVEIADMTEGRKVFQSIDTLASFIEEHTA